MESDTGHMLPALKPDPLPSGPLAPGETEGEPALGSSSRLPAPCLLP